MTHFVETFVAVLPILCWVAPTVGAAGLVTWATMPALPTTPGVQRRSEGRRQPPRPSPERSHALCSRRS